ncbi:MAG: dCTP deaminase [Candidatus Micrarchaeota archaeon]
MILSDNDIREHLKKGIIKISPIKPDQIGQASVDLTLSNEWGFFKEKYLQGEVVDLDKVAFQEANKKIIAKEIILQHDQMCLATTVEKITLPRDIMGLLGGRSRYARMGLTVHITSAIVQPGSSNHQVLEIVNFAPFPIKLHAGMRVSQVTFHKLESASSKPYAKFGKIARNQ